MKILKIFLLFAIITYSILGILGSMGFIPATHLLTYFEKTSFVLGILFIASGSIAILFKKSSTTASEQKSSQGPQF